MYETANVLSIINKNKAAFIGLAVILMATGVMAVSNSAFQPSRINVVSEIKYLDDGNAGNSITFYQDGTFYIEQSNGNNLAGTYIENPKSYGIKYTNSGYGETLDKTANGIMVPDGKGTEEWVRV